MRFILPGVFRMNPLYSLLCFGHTPIFKQMPAAAFRFQVVFHFHAQLPVEQPLSLPLCMPESSDIVMSQGALNIFGGQ
jgi:hypothetical protein